MSLLTPWKGRSGDGECGAASSCGGARDVAGDCALGDIEDVMAGLSSDRVAGFMSFAYTGWGCLTGDGLRRPAGDTRGNPPGDGLFSRTS